MINIIINLYIYITLFFAGYFMSNELSQYNGRLDFITKIIASLVYAFFIAPFFLINILLDCTEKYIPLKFLFSFYFTKKYKNLNPEQLEMMNKWASEKENNWSGYVFKFGAKMVNKRYGK